MEVGAVKLEVRRDAAGCRRGEARWLFIAYSASAYLIGAII
jgi:hypothetical protein